VRDAVLLLISMLAWPTIIFVLALLLLTIQRKPVGRLIDRIQSVKYPGGEAELGGVLAESHIETITKLVDALPGNVRDALARNGGDWAPKAGEEVKPTQNREPLAEFAPLPVADAVDLVALRTKLENVLSELAYPPPVEDVTSVSRLIEVLVNRGVLEPTTAGALKEIVEIADQAAAGAVVPRKLASAVGNSGPAILDQLALLRSMAAGRFENHVLDVLQRDSPAQWLVRTDASLGGQDGADPAVGTTFGLAARVDALVTAGPQRAIVEVRARVHTGAPRQIAALHDWLAALPEDIPVLIVLLGHGLRGHEFRQLRSDHAHPVDVLLWDEQSDLFITAVRGMLDAAP
jgi:hypothetical protein